MIERFENLTAGIATVNKQIQKIKKYYMEEFGLKGAHVMCLYYLQKSPEGLTCADLSLQCGEDKAGISRIMAKLEEEGYISYPDSDGSTDNRKRYRAKASLTEKGKAAAAEVRKWAQVAAEMGSRGISDEDSRTFYRVLFQISENLQLACNQLDAKSK